MPAQANEIPVINDGGPLAPIELKGPGGRIHGADISRWQHPNGKLINFVKMRAAGLNFVMIKGSDTRDDADALARKWLRIDREAAHAAGIYTGFYHYAILPNVPTKTLVIKDAEAQAQKVLWRIASIGGLTEKDLPIALDIENKCVKYRPSKTCAKHASQSTVTTWSETFLRIIKEKTGRVPIIYSYSNFLESSMKRSTELAQYPLWLAHYKVNPAIETNHPGMKNSGCYVHSWTAADCKAQWTMWQYTSCGIAPKYGVPGNRLDLNVFRGTPEAFAALRKGTWTPEPADLMPIGEPSVMTIKSVTFSNTNRPLVVDVDVMRPSLAPVVTGSVKFVQDPANPMNVSLKQSALRATSGSWTLSVAGIPAGIWSG
ncbi:MAG: lysozyme M1 (1,4-beta-N-acetylmuramidase), partial [Actinobacteria bacterium]|nr:lysozyme M1 (1,4-beta-N-acetylmuramidase) [Actinomycetota bacterium]